jgi:MoaA/NifB/PqqE/SkfB family radical SAM enzyme
LQLRFGRQKAWGLPYEWEIDTTNICQLKCPLCHTGLGTIHRDKGIMHYGLFTRTIDQIKDYCIWLTLYSWGEPFLNRRIHEFVGYAHQNRIATIISSNLNKPLTSEMAENIIKSGLDVMIISIDGVTQDVYQIYRVGGHLDRVLNNVKLLVQKKKELGYQTPHLEWQFIVMRQNEHQIPEARKLAAELGVDAIVFKKVDFPHGEDDPKVAEQWLPRNHPEYLRPQPFYKPYHEDGERCWRLWRSGVVNWDGGYAPCCYLTDESDDFGNVNTSPVREIWNNQSYVTARGLFKDGYMPTKQIGCLSCSVYLGSRAARKRGPLLIPLEPVKVVSNEARGSHSALDGSERGRAPVAPLAVEKSERPVEP